MSISKLQQEPANAEKMPLDSCYSTDYLVESIQLIYGRKGRLYIMMYPYITLADETEIVHSHIIDREGIQTVEVHFERPTETGFASARCILPTYQWKFSEGFSQEEMDFFDEFLRHNAHLLYRYAAQGGIHCA